MTEVPVTDWANYEGDLPEQYPHRQPRKLNRGTEPIEGPDRKAYTKEKRRRLKARSPTLTVTKVETNKKMPRLDDITFENGLVTGYSKSKNAKVGDKFVVSAWGLERDPGRYAHILDAEEDSTGIQIMIPAEEVEKITNHFGITQEKLELIMKHAITEELETSDGYTNYTGRTYKRWPLFNLQYSEADPYQRKQREEKRNDMKRREAERDAWAKLSPEEKQEWKAKWRNSGRPKGQRMRFSDLLEAEEGNAPIQDPMELGEMANWTPLDGSEGLKRKRAENDDYVFCEGCGEERKSVGPDSVFTIDNARGDVLDDGNVLCDRCHTRGYKIERDAESPSATNPIKQPSWIAPVATALGFGLGFLVIKQLKKEL